MGKNFIILIITNFIGENMSTQTQLVTQTLNQMNIQLQMMFSQINSILQSYGIKLYLYKIRTTSEACETCVEYIWVFEFKDKKVYESFVNSLKGKENE